MNDESRGIGDNRPPEPIEWTEDRLREIDPTKLLVVPVDHLTQMADVQFPEIVERFVKLLAAAETWQHDHIQHDGSLVPIADNQENNKLTDFMLQLADFAGDDGEIETVRKSCKEMLAAAVKVLDGHWNQRREAIMAIHGDTQSAHPSTMQYAQTSYMMTSGHDKSRSAMGNTVSLASTQNFRLTSIKDLCRAVADGTAPETFVVPDKGAINRAIRRKESPVRKCAGIVIDETFAASRRRG